MAKGGKREPKGPRPPSGVGKFSRRTDGQQVATAPVQDSEAMLRGRGQDWGDAQKNRIAQGIQPLAGSAPMPQQRPSAAGPEAGGGGAVPQDGLPPWFFQMESGRPGEPGTAGLDVGAGPGSEVLEPIQEPEDDAEIVLAMLEREFGDHHASQMLHEIRLSRQAVAAPTAPGAPLTPGAPQPPAEEEVDFPLPAEEAEAAPSAITPPPEDEPPAPDDVMPAP